MRFSKAAFLLLASFGAANEPVVVDSYQQQDHVHVRPDHAPPVQQQQPPAVQQQQAQIHHQEQQAQHQQAQQHAAQHQVPPVQQQQHQAPEHQVPPVQQQQPEAAHAQAAQQQQEAGRAAGSSCDSEIRAHNEARTRLGACEESGAALTRQAQECATKSASDQEVCASRVHELQSLSQKLEQELSESRTLVESKLSEAQKELRTHLQQVKEQLDNEKKLRSSETAKHKEATRVLTQQVLETRREASQTVNKMTAEIQELQGQLQQFTKTVYSSVHFKNSVTHLSRIGRAFFQFIQKRLKTALGVDLIRVSQLQLTVWKAKLSTRAQPALMKARDLYMQHCDKHSKHLKPLVNLWHRLLTSAELSMDRVVRNLSTVDPDIATIFPDAFYDRCFAFAFVILVGYVLIGAVQSLLYAVFVKPVVALSTRFRPTKRATKSGASTSARNTALNKNTLKKRVLGANAPATASDAKGKRD